MGLRDMHRSLELYIRGGVFGVNAGKDPSFQMFHSAKDGLFHLMIFPGKNERTVLLNSPNLETLLTFVQHVYPGLYTAMITTCDQLFVTEHISAPIVHSS